MVEKKNKANKVGVLLNMLILIFLFAVGAGVMLSKFQVSNNVKLYVVLSGSMEPSIRTGSVVLIKHSREYTVGDVITFNSSGNVETVVTHRITSISEDNGITKYETKGDANDASDFDLVLAPDVLGRILLSIPWLGYPVSFAQTQVGFILLIVLPVTIIIYGEILKIKTEVLKKIEDRKKKETDE